MYSTQPRSAQSQNSFHYKNSQIIPDFFGKMKLSIFPKEIVISSLNDGTVNKNSEVRF